TERLDLVVKHQQLPRPGRVDERQAAEVDMELTTLAIERAAERSFELRTGDDVQLARYVKGLDSPVPAVPRTQENLAHNRLLCPRGPLLLDGLGGSSSACRRGAPGSRSRFRRNASSSRFARRLPFVHRLLPPGS